MAEIKRGAFKGKKITYAERDLVEAFRQIAVVVALGRGGGTGSAWHIRSHPC
jgi:hypothetical protein